MPVIRRDNRRLAKCLSLEFERMTCTRVWRVERIVQREYLLAPRIQLPLHCRSRKNSGRYYAFIVP